MSEGRLLHTGQVVLDLVLRVPALPPVGGDVFATAPTGLTPGGGFNVMAAAARAGARVRYLGGHGDGHLGEAARAGLAAEGIEVAFAATVGVDTGVSVAMVDRTGERTFVTAPGAESALDPAALAAEPVTSADLVYVSGYSLVADSKRDVLLDWLAGLPAWRDRPVAAAAGPGGPLVLADPGPLAAEINPVALARLLARVDVLSCNAREARLLSAVAEPGAAAGVLAERVRPGAAVLVRDGAAGCWLAAGGPPELIPGVAVTAVDTNGAGDAHCGVLAAELLRRADLATAVARANAAAALAVTRRGPATAPTRAEVDALLAVHPVR
ncbi:MAG TPA: PfkB family carbohydrate kinase [Pseudonocardia sp.]|nr:PfkB family carbohydrate kinase [Pseudonocardia sp.]